jgi:hypothetical protein
MDLAIAIVKNSTLNFYLSLEFLAKRREQSPNSNKGYFGHTLRRDRCFG